MNLPTNVQKNLELKDLRKKLETTKTTLRVEQMNNQSLLNQIEHLKINTQTALFAKDQAMKLAENNLKESLNQINLLQSNLTKLQTKTKDLAATNNSLVLIKEELNQEKKKHAELVHQISKAKPFILQISEMNEVISRLKKELWRKEEELKQLKIQPPPRSLSAAKEIFQLKQEVEHLKLYPPINWNGLSNRILNLAIPLIMILITAMACKMIVSK